MYKSRFQGEIQARTRSLKVTSIQTILKVMGLHENTQRMDKERCEVQNWLLGPTSFGGGAVGDREASTQETQGGTVTEAERESTEQNSRSQVSKSFSSRRE